MAKNGFKVFDSDMHIMEPVDLWERYIAPEFRSEAPRGRTSENVRDLGLIFPNSYPAALRTRGTPHKVTTTKRTKASTAITLRAGGPVKSNSRRWTPKALTLRCCFPREDWACLPIPTTTHGSPRLWRAHTTTGFMTFAEPIRPACLAPG